LKQHTFHVGQKVRAECLSCNVAHECQDYTEEGAVFTIHHILDWDLAWEDNNDRICDMELCVPAQIARIEGNELILEDQ